MKITILGCGGAGGVPMVSVGWLDCDPDNPKNRRRRPSILVETGEKVILVDTSPDLREQLIENNVRHLDAVFYTHDHADHLHGIDDLREINRAMRSSIPVYGASVHLDVIEQRFSYAFHPMSGEKDKPIYKPFLVPHPVSGPFDIGKQQVIPFEQDHGYGVSTGYRFGNFAFSTDVLNFPEQSEKFLYGLDLWIVGCLLEFPHPSHAHIDKVLDWVDKFRPKRTILTHMGPRLDYDSLKDFLPHGIEPAYDGMVLDSDSAAGK